MTTHQEKQIEVINAIEKQVKNNALNFTTVTPVADFENDPRICLTSVHIPHKNLITKIQEEIINPLKEVEPDLYYYPSDSYHMTIKNIRVICNPSSFTNEDVLKAEKVFSEVVPLHYKFQVYFYRLLLFPNNVALIGTTDPELDNLVLDLDRKLEAQNLSDDKIYSNSRYFFCNVTLARFLTYSDKFKEVVDRISSSILLEPYTIDSVTLTTSNAVFAKKKIINTWSLK